MRIALISDIHANLIALEAILAEIQREHVDQIVCLGDVAAIGPQPVQVIRRLSEIGCRLVMGNTDEEVLRPELFTPENERATRILEIIQWNAQQPEPSDVDFIKRFEPTVELSLGKHNRLLCYHGSPRSNMEPILPTTPDAELDEMLSGVEATVLAGGYTHVQMLRPFQNKWLINPGSVGLPVQRGALGEPDRRPFLAEYAIVSSDAEIPQIEFRRVPLDLDSLRRAVLASGMPQAEWWLKEWQ